MKSLYVLSDNLIVHDVDENEKLVYNSLFNQPRVIDAKTYDLLSRFSNPIGVDDIHQDFSGEIDEVVSKMMALHWLKTVDQCERELLKKSQTPFLDSIADGHEFGRLELAITDACNLGCSHCMHFKNAGIENTASPTLNMSIDVAKNAIDEFVKEARKKQWNKIRVHFGNGEPLLNWKTLSFCIEYCESIKDISFEYAMNSNLTLLTDKKVEFLAKYKVGIATSIDGLKESNDLIRVDQAGKGTFDKIIDRIHLLREKGHPISGFTITVTSKNFHLINDEVIDLAVDLNVSDIALDFDLVSDFSLDITKCVELVMNLRKLAKSRGLKLYGTWETPYRNLMNQSWSKQPYSFCPAMEGKTLEVGIDGHLKTCGHTNTQVGHVSNLAQVFSPESEFLNLISSRLAGVDEYCHGCEIEAACGGQCHVTREAVDNLERMCEFLRQITKALLIEQAKDS